MTVYVDKAVHPYGRMLMCHMLADSPDELHQMADLIGVARKHFQHQASTPHYDICKAKRSEAILRGAREVNTNADMAATIKAVRGKWIAIGWRRPQEDPDGRMVAYPDYAKLEARIRKLRAAMHTAKYESGGLMRIDFVHADRAEKSRRAHVVLDNALREDDASQSDSPADSGEAAK